MRKADEQVNNVFMRRVAVFPPHGLDVSDNFFSVQRPIADIPGAPLSRRLLARKFSTCDADPGLHGIADCGAGPVRPLRRKPQTRT